MDFEEEIDWNFAGYGKLWTYNLNYFEYLDQPGMTKMEGLRLIHDQISNWDKLSNGLEPFPISLSVLYWIKFLVKHNVKDERIDQALYSKLQILKNNLEYHLLGNHLLENGYALLFGAVYFNDHRFGSKAENILSKELREQVLKDGAHFERSPMYHHLMLYRILDCINLLQQNQGSPGCSLLPVLEDIGARMLGWMQVITFRNGDLPLLNDSTNGVAPSAEELNGYANRLGIKAAKVSLSESGYRKHVAERYELLADVGNIGPDYIPGHAHADTLSFEMQIDGRPFLVDTGVSTYEKNHRRQLERSTAAHNTVQVADDEQSDIWGGFRVGQRARAYILMDSSLVLCAAHDGFHTYKARHCRQWEFDKSSVTITDTIEGAGQLPAKAYFHFHPEVEVSVKGSSVVTNIGNLSFQGARKLELTPYFYAPSFNKLDQASLVIVHFYRNLFTSISL